MGKETGISWTHHSWNIAWGCEKTSPGCTHCFAENQADHGRMAYRQDGQIVGIWGKGRPRRTFGPKHWQQPISWNRAAAQANERRRVFCSSMTDVFLDDPTIAAEREKLWPLIRATQWLDWLLLTKRADRIANDLPADWSPERYPNVWLGVSIENNDYAHRADALREIPAVVRFVSYEPAIGPLDRLELDGLDWVIVGGESGNGSNNYRPEDKQWARDMRDRCKQHGVAFYHKQSAGQRTNLGIELDGEILHNYPTPRYPEGIYVPGRQVPQRL